MRRIPPGLLVGTLRPSVDGPTCRVARGVRREAPREPAKVRGPQALAAIVRETRGYFDELEFTVEVGPIVEGDLVAARWIGRGTFQGTSVDLSGHDFLGVRSSRFSEYWVIAEQPS